MIGLDLIRRLHQILSESPSSQWMDLKTSYDCLFEAAQDFAKEVKALHSTQTITSVVSLTWPYLYPLNPDFMEVLTQDNRGDKKIQLISGTNISWPSRAAYSHILKDRNTTAVATPNRFAIIDDTPASRITGTTTASSTNAGGESNLTDSTADFSLVNVGADVVNTTSGKEYIGKVLSVTSGTSLVTAMFDISGVSSYANWTSGDTYLVLPKAQYALVIDPPPSSGSLTITVPYICKPSPVYSDYGSYGFATGYEEALIKYAIWLYKYRDSKGNQGDALYRYYDAQLRKAKNINRAATQPRGFKVSLLKG